MEISKAQTEKFAMWFLNLSTKVAEINKTHGSYVNLKLGNVQGIPIVDITIPGYGKNPCVDEVRLSPIVDDWKFDTVWSALESFEAHLVKQKKTLNFVRAGLAGQAPDELQALCDFLFGTKEEPLTRRERMLYEMALAELVRQLPAAR